MKTTRTIKIKVGESKDFDQLLEKFLAACNWTSKQVFESKVTNCVRLHKKFYTPLRKQFDLPSQLTCSVFRYVTPAYKSNKSQNRWRECKFTRKVMPVVWERDFSFAKTKGVCFWGKPIQLLDHRLPPMEAWQDSKLKRVDGIWYLLLCYEIEISEPKANGCIVGVDSGIKRIFTATNSKNSKTFTFHGGELNSRRCRIRRTKAKIQSVGTRSSRRLLQRLSGNEASITEHLLHCASKRLVSWAEKQGAQRIVMENLANIREASIAKGKEMRSVVHRWPYAMGQFFVQYKAQAKGVSFELVSPKNTSRGCPCCGYVDKGNRNLLKFRCRRCCYRGDADRVASINIRNRSVVTRHNLVTTGTGKCPESTEPFEITTGVSATGLTGSCDATLVVV